MHGAAGSHSTAVPRLCSSVCPVGRLHHEHRVGVQQWSPTMGSSALQVVGEAHMKPCSVPDLLVLVLAADFAQPLSLPSRLRECRSWAHRGPFVTHCAPAAAPIPAANLQSLGCAFGSRVCVWLHTAWYEVPVRCLAQGSISGAPEWLCVCCGAAVGVQRCGALRSAAAPAWGCQCGSAGGLRS